MLPVLTGGGSLRQFAALPALQSAALPRTSWPPSANPPPLPSFTTRRPLDTAPSAARAARVMAASNEPGAVGAAREAAAGDEILTAIADLEQALAVREPVIPALEPGAIPPPTVDAEGVRTQDWPFGFNPALARMWAWLDEAWGSEHVPGPKRQCK